MYRFAVTLALALGFGVPSAPALPTSTPTEAKIKLLVEQLSSNDARKREDAAKELDSIGMPALEALRKATKSEDAEVARLAKGLVGKLETKLANQRLLEPTWVELKLKDATVSDAVAELAKQSGVPISVAGLTKERLVRKITLDTGKVPFWTALDKLCEVAQIRETDAVGNGAVQPAFENIGIRIAPAIRAVPAQALPAVPPVPVVPAVEVKKEEKKEEKAKEAKQEDKKEEPKKAEPKKDEVKKEEAKKEEPKPVMPVAQAIEVIQIQGQGQVPVPIQVQVPVQIQGGQIQVQGGAIQIQPQPANVPVNRRVGMITLEEGKAKEVPTHVEGAFRIRSMAHLPTSAYVPNVGADEIVFLLQAQAEPRINVLSTARVKIDKAINENGQNLSISEPKADAAPIPPQPIPLNGGPAPLIIRRANMPANVLAYNNQPFPVRLKKSDKETKTIKELTGTVTLSVRSAAEAMVEIEDLAKAKDDTVKGKNDCSLKVTEMSKDEDGVYTLKVEVSSPSTVMPFAHQPTEEERKRFLGRAQAAQPAQPAPNVARVLPAQAWNTNGLELFDAKGNAYEYAGTSSQTRIQNATRVIQAVVKFAPKEKGQGEPTKLVFKGTRPAEVEVPFTLKDIVLGK